MTETVAPTFGDQVYVVNQDPHPWTFKWGGKKYVLEPEKKTPVPFEAMVLWAGDPRSSDSMRSFREGAAVSFIPDRDSELRRLTVKYGGDNDAVYPKLSFYDLDDNPITTVIDDPEGKEVLTANVTIMQNEEQAEKIKALEDKLARVMATLEGTPAGHAANPEPTESASSDTGDIPEDTTGTGSSSKGPGKKS